MDTDLPDLLNFLQEPAFILDGHGGVQLANRAAIRALGVDPHGCSLTDFTTGEPDQVSAYLSRCSGRSEPLVGAIRLRDGGGEERRFRAYGARLPDRGCDVRIALRLKPAGVDEFSILARKVAELNHEILKRRQIQAHLEESLHHNETLLRELHHRVKNNIQIMVGLFSASRRESTSEEVRAFLSDAIGRLIAIGAAQQIIYDSQNIESISANEFLQVLCGAIGATFGPGPRIESVASHGHLASRSTFPLALIINELLTNAIKHAPAGEAATIEVRLVQQEGEWVLTVADHGPGLPTDLSERRSSGLGLVKGLARQLGGSVSVENGPGARISVRFHDGRLH